MNLPTGAVTFLFTDIEGSTQLWEAHPEAMQVALARHDTLLHDAIGAHRGQVVKSTGDGLHAVFASPAQAVAACVAAQRTLQAEPWPAKTPLRVRMGLHTGEAELRDGDYFGPAVNRSARLMAVAAGGQVLASQVTFHLVQDSLPDGAGLIDLGEHRLKDLVRPEHVFQLVIPDLATDFPPLRSLNAFAHNLPVQLTSFVGREREIVEVRRLLGAMRLLTLTGPGGTGKTRLSLQVAAEVAPEFAGGVWLVELAPLADPALLVAAVAAVFDLRELPGRTLAAILVDYLRGKSLLLVLDNCEHMIDACARLAGDLLLACPHLKIIASSREGLGLSGETIFRVPSLSLPEGDDSLPDSLAQSEAVCLFAERAQAAQPHFSLTSANAPAVAAIVRRLDGIPLALELAAARVKLLSAEQIAARLDDRFRLLVGGSRTALPRQQTLRALIDWSYDLLPEPECRLLRELSVFVGGWTLEAAEQVGTGSDVLEDLSQLVNKSLVLVDDQDIGTRYRLLETIRQYAREKLLEAGEAEETRRCHLGYFVKLAEAAEPRLSGRDMITVLDQMEQEMDNLRQALEWALETDPMAALRLVGSLQLFWGRRTSASEALEWARAALARTEDATPGGGEEEKSYLTNRAKTLMAQGSLYLLVGNSSAARTSLEASVALARQAQASVILGSALGIGAVAIAFLGDVATARAWADEARSLFRQQNSSFGLAIQTGFWMFLAAVTGGPLPIGTLEEGLRVARALENPWALALALQIAGRLTSLTGNTDEALDRLEQSAVLLLQLRDRPFYTASRSDIGHVLRQAGRYDEAMAIYRETLRAWQELGHRAAVAHELECFAFIAVTTGDDPRAATLFGAAEALREAIGSSMNPIERREYDLALSDLRRQMPAGLLAPAWAQGRAMPMDDAITLALAEPAA